MNERQASHDEGGNAAGDQYDHVTPVPARSVQEGIETKAAQQCRAVRTADAGEYHAICRVLCMLRVAIRRLPANAGRRWLMQLVIPSEKDSEAFLRDSWPS